MSITRLWVKIVVVAIACWIPGKYALASFQNQVLPGVPFVKNEGKLNSDVAFYSKLFSGDIYVMEDGRMVYSLTGEMPGEDDKALSMYRTFLAEELIGAHPVKPVASESSSTRLSYFLGQNPEDWQIDIPTYNSILMAGAWDKIDLELKAYQKNVEKLFTLQPGAKVSDIQLKLSGTEKLEIGQGGTLLANTDLGAITFTAPIAWQIIEGKKESISIHYFLDSEHAQTYGFRVGQYDTELALYIDPLLQSTFLGGSGSDSAESIAIAANGDVYVSGRTWISTVSTNDFPGIAGGVDEVAVSGEVFVARLSSDLTTLHQATYLGGGQDDRGHGLALAANGDVILIGETHSADFPGVSGGLDEGLSGTWDGFVTRLDSTLTNLIQSTYLGGGADDHAWAVMIEPGEQIIIAGESRSPDFPGVTGGAYSTVSANGTNAFLTRLSSDLTSVSQSTFYGGSSSERPYGLGVGSNGDFYLAGFTTSPDLTDTTGGAYTSYAGYEDGFIVQIASDLKSVKQASYLGGPVAPGGKSSETTIRALAIAANGDIYVGGDTNSDQIPGISGGAITDYKNGFISQLDANLTTFKQSTYIGGTNNGGRVQSLTFFRGDLLVAGSESGDGFPAISGGDDTSSSSDAYLAKIALNLNTIKQSTFIGGENGYEEIGDVVVASNGTIYVAGGTSSNDFHKTEGGADTNFGELGQLEGFVSMFDSLTAVNVEAGDECSFFVLSAKTGLSVVCF